MTEDAVQRSKTMRAVKSKDTTPELLVRKLLHKNGYRYRLHRKDPVGKPDRFILDIQGFITKNKANYLYLKENK